MHFLRNITFWMNFNEMFTRGCALGHKLFYEYIFVANLQILSLTKVKTGRESKRDNL